MKVHLVCRQNLFRGIWSLVIPNEARNGASGASNMDGCAAMVAARESGEERVNLST
jgi:hypothetical protein